MFSCFLNCIFFIYNENEFYSIYLRILLLDHAEVVVELILFHRLKNTNTKLSTKNTKLKWIYRIKLRQWNEVAEIVDRSANSNISIFFKKRNWIELTIEKNTLLVVIQSFCHVIESTHWPWTRLLLSCK